MRADQHRAAAGGGFDQVLPAKGQQCSADQRDVGQCKIGRHLAHAVTEPDACFGRRQCAFAAPAQPELALLDQRGDFGKALRVARHEQQEQIRSLKANKGVQDERFFAFARAGGQPYRSLTERLPPVRAELQLLGRWRDVELDVAEDADAFGADSAQSFGVGRRLCSHRT